MNQKQALEEILTKIGDTINIENLLLHRKLQFPIYVETAIMNEDLSELDLSVRSSNCLRRAGFHTIGDLVSGITKSDDLLKIRNCGANSAKEIMQKLFIHQYSVITGDRQIKWLNEIVRLNQQVTNI